MGDTANKLSVVIAERPVRDPVKLAKQQEYYDRLKRAGIAKKMPYGLKPISVI